MPGRRPGAGPASIYQWLPFTAAELARAAATATRFGALYDTFSYTESARSYTAKMSSVITGQLAATLARAYATPGVAGPRVKSKQVSVGSASITSLRAFGPGSMTFIVAIRQKITDQQGVSRSSGQFAVTVAGSGPSWQVTDIELAVGGQLMMGPGGPSGRGRGVVIAVVCMAGLLILGLIAAPMLFFASSSELFTSGSGCSAAQGKTAGQPPPSQQARNSIPANYLALFKATGHKYGIPWVVLAGIGRVESDDGRTTLPGVHSGSNAFGAAGPMQIGIGGASGDTWGGAAVHPAGEKVSGVAIDANHDGVASVYQPADAIAGAARYLLEHGILDNVFGAIFAYNHLESYVQTVLSWAGTYSTAVSRSAR